MVIGDGHTTSRHLLDLADTVRLEHNETRWTDFTRYSQRSGEQDVEGFVGQAWYGGKEFEAPLAISLARYNGCKSVRRM